MPTTSWEKLFRNIVTQYAGTGLSIFTGLVMVPIVIHTIGLVDFGLWALAGGIVGSLGLLDAGLAPTLTKKAAESLALNDEVGLGRTASEIFGLYLLIGILAGVVVCALAFFAGNVFHVAPADLARFRIVLLIVAFQLALSFPLSTWGGIIAGLQDFHFLSTVGIVINVAKLVVTVVLMKTGFGLISLMWLGLFATAVGGVANIFWVKRRLPALRMVGGRPWFFASRDVLRFSGAMFIWAITGRILLEAPRLLIAVFMPVSAVGIYEVGLRICNYSRSVVYPMFTFLPAASDLNARNEEARLRQLYLVGTKYFLLAYAFVAGAVLLFGKQFIFLWLGGDFEQSVQIMIVLVMGTLYQTQNMVAHVMLPGMGRVRAFTWIMALYPLVNIGLSIVLLKRFGLIGVAMGTVGSYLLLETVFLFFITSILKVSISKLLFACHFPVLMIVTPATIIAYYFSRVIPAKSWLTLLTGGVIFFLAFAFALFTYGLSRPERARIREVASRLIPRPA
jgi:O-antigen/teichoic acid export membrane protein